MYKRQVVAFVHSLFDHGNTVSRVVAGGLEVVEVDAVGLAEGLAGFVRGLVDGLVCLLYTS